MRSKSLSAAAAAAILGGLLVAAPAPAKEKAAKDTDDSAVVANVNGEPVTKAEWSAIMKADAWQAQSLRTTPGFLEKMQGKPNEDFFFKEEVVKIRAMAQKYKENLPQMKSAIYAIHAKLKAGEDFATLAKQYSQDAGSAANGGDLGGLKEFHELVFPFNRVVMALKQGEISEPILTVYGYHIAKVERIQPPVEGKGKKVAVRNILIRFPSQSPAAEAETLAAQAKVEVLDKPLCKKLPSYCQPEG